MSKKIKKLDEPEYYTDCYAGKLENINSEIEDIKDYLSEITEKINEIIDRINKMSK